ncbi:helical backbone metal receptor [uncultured Tessaracoccus sp.]|uniref:helical backbone metal receptor n=1 Tax=uncultured Tessaracoccus sp. TaxID=905023 RepID=UPI0025E56073|nr:helical backbone metal receptor [uncultured Tessaracoccus sp.]
MHVVDDLGREFELAAPPRRVVSLVPSLTEAIATSAPGLLVGATEYCVAPPWLDVERVRGTKNPDLARIAALRPELVVANEEENRELDVRRLRERGIDVWVTRIDTVDEALASLRRLLHVLDAPHLAWLDEAERVWAEPAPFDRARVAVPIWRDPWMWVGANTYADDVLRRLGLVNVVARDHRRYPHLEQTAVGADALVLLPDEPYPFGPADREDFARSTLVEGRWLFWYGPTMVRARRALVDACGAALA